MANHLAGETSPYLLQHAGNPVDWYPWGREALDKARTEDKPIFLSIGYSSCHWCHVMEHQSFENKDVADFLNEHFVSIKVDREERPDLDAVYLDAVRALTGGGGWPLSVWITPEGDPFFGGTYFPPQPMRGTPSFRQVLEAIADAWVTKRASLAQTAAAVRDHLAGEAAAQDGAAAPAAPDYAPLLHRADDDLHASADPRDGGWGGAPKFPQSMVLEYLLARQTVKPRPELHLDLRVTLDAMAAGGMYDQVGGGFHRYSTDGYWLVPHFEKMLYDNAQLARCYTHAWQSLGIARYRAVAAETLDYLLREMRHERGGFFSAQDADTSEGEGTYFTWTPAEVREALDPEEATLVENTYGLTEQGNFESRNILHIPARFPLPDAEPGPDDALLARARAKLLALRQTRPQPARDDKVLAAWNGLALAAFADAATAFASPVYRAAAEKAGDFLLEEMTAPATTTDVGAGAGPSASGATGGDAAAAPAGAAATLSLLHSWKNGPRPGEGFLDDYACVAEGLLALYACTLDERWFVAARALVDTLLQRFGRPAGGFYDTGAEHEVLITRPRATYDSPTPSGTAMAATVLLKLTAYTGQDHYREAAEEALASLAGVADAAPVMSGQWLCAALAAHEGLAEVAIVGDFDAPEMAALLDEARRRFRPLAVLAARRPGARTEIALLLDREPSPGSPAAAWVCRHSTCAAPVTDPAGLRSLLEAE